MKNKAVFKVFEECGDIYIKEHLQKYKNKSLEDNWWKGLKFFFSKSFNRGRRDELSHEYFEFTIEKLKDKYIIPTDNPDNAYQLLKKDKKYFDKSKLLEKRGEKNQDEKKKLEAQLSKGNPVYRMFTQFEDKSKKTHLGNIEDIMMVFDVLNFITEKEENKNIYIYILKKLRDNKTKDVYDELKSKKFRSIADKIATFIIRDIYLLNPDISTKDIDSNLAFPIDTWVRQITDEIEPGLKNDTERKKFLVQQCEELKLNPLKVAAGIWYVGAKSLSILLKNLENIECY